MRIAAAAGRLRLKARVPTVGCMRGTFRLALGGLALATLTTIGCRTSALRPLYQTSDTTGGLPATTPPPITLPSPTVPGQSTPPPTLPTTPQIADTSNFPDGDAF